MEYSATALRALPQNEQIDFLSSLSDKEAAVLTHDWKFWARANQLAPLGDWTHWLLLAGRGFGKTRTGAEWTRDCAETGNSKTRIALVAPTAADARDVMVEGEGGLLSVCPPWNLPEYQSSKRKVTWPNGATAHLYSADKPERLRGPQHHFAWCFISGTMITTKNGDVPVESLNVGDEVQTRNGHHPISHTSIREMPVGTVKFSNGASLTGTADHPVLTSHGWTNMSNLKEGDTVCVVNASNGVEKGGTDTAVVITNTEAQGRKTGKIETGYIEQNIGMRSEKSNKGLISIIKMVISQITILKTLNVYLTRIIKGSMFWQTQFLELIGVRNRLMPTYATDANYLYLGSKTHQGSFSASPAKQKERKLKERLNDTANTAIVSSLAAAENIAVSVVSTWERAGQADVFNIKVKDVPEYYANGILTHNCDELCAWQYQQEAWDMLMFGLRLGIKPQTCITTTPKPTKMIRGLIDQKNVNVTHGTTFDNLDNLAPTFREEIIAKYEGTRLGRQELMAEILDDVVGALWARKQLDENRRSKMPDLMRIVVAVDPPTTSGENADECGIVVAAVGTDNRGYVLADLSEQGLTPNEWAKKAVNAYHEWQADRLVAEVNQGGDMVETIMRKVDDKVSYKGVHATKGKVVRAEPVAALYEQNRISHVGTHANLEDQMCQFTLDFNKKTMGYSPDRVDALVWAFTELMLKPMNQPRIRML